MGKTDNRCEFVRSMGTFQSSILPVAEYNRRYCLCRGVAATLTLLPENVSFYRNELSERGKSVSTLSEYLLESNSVAEYLKAYLPTFAPDCSGDHQMHSRQFEGAISNFDREEIRNMVEYAQMYNGNNAIIDRLAKIKLLSGNEYDAMIGILREMAYIDYQQKHYKRARISDGEIMERSKCKLYTRAAFEELSRFRAR